MSLRAVAAEAGFAPAALYGYFRGKDELLLALAADDLTVLARAMREAGGLGPGGRRGAGAAGQHRNHGGGLGRAAPAKARAVMPSGCSMAA